MFKTSSSQIMFLGVNVRKWAKGENSEELVCNSNPINITVQQDFLWSRHSKDCTISALGKSAAAAAADIMKKM